MGLSFDQVLSQLRVIGDGAQVEMALVSNQDDEVVSYARGFLVYHVHHFIVEEGLSRTTESLVGDSIQYLFNVNLDAIFVDPDAGGFGGKSLLQPFSVKAAEQLQVSFRSTPEIATNPVTIELTLLSEENDAFSVELTPLGDVLHGVGRHVGLPQAIDDFVAEAVYLVSFGKPSPSIEQPH